MLNIFKKKPAPLLSVRVNGEELCRVLESDVPCEVKPKACLPRNSTLSFVDAAGVGHTHRLGALSGWFHFSVRIHPNLGCQADCVISSEEALPPGAFEAGEVLGIRFQPFYLPFSKAQNTELHGQGLFARGLHFNGLVTNSNVLLSCQCDQCDTSFLIRSYHAGFSNAGYFYSESGRYTITVEDHIAGSPAALTEPDPEQLRALEERLPLAPDGSAYRYMNPFRCPHCAAPYIDFAAHPGLRKNEYYGNYFVGSDLLRYTPADA